MNKKQEAKRHYSVRLLEKKYKEVCSFGGGSFSNGIEFILDFISGKNQNVTQLEPKRHTFGIENVTQNENIKMNDKMQQFLGNKIDTVVVQEEEKKQPTAFQQTKIGDINRLTSNGMKSHREDGEEFTRKDLMTRAGLLDFL